MTPTANFTTPLPPGDTTPYKFIVYGDMAVDPFPEAVSTAKLVREEVAKNDIKFVYHHGDISYARGYVSYIIEIIHATRVLHRLSYIYMVTLLTVWHYNKMIIKKTSLFLTFRLCLLQSFFKCTYLVDYTLFIQLFTIFKFLYNYYMINGFKNYRETKITKENNYIY